LKRLIEGSYYYQKEALSLLAMMKSLYPLLFFILHFFQHLNSPRASSHQPASVNVVSSFVYAVRFMSAITSDEDETNNLSEDRWNKILFSLPSYLRTVIELSLDQAKSEASALWPLPVLKWMNRNDLCGECACLCVLFYFDLIFYLSFSQQI
jgi:hypothetical protein